MEQVAPKILLAAPANPIPPTSQMIVEVARRDGVSPLRQMREMWALRGGQNKLSLTEYYDLGVFAADMPLDVKKTFVGVQGNKQLNMRLSPMKITAIRSFTNDKVMYTSLLDRLGVATTHTQAVVHPYRAFGTLPVLRDVQAITTYLKNEAVYPIFGKPCNGSRSVGSALITECSGDMLRLGNGREADVAGFAQELIEDYPEGFIFQSAIQQHPDLTKVAGPSIGTLRVVTLRDENGPKVLYSLWKIPSPSAMSDNFWQAGSMLAHVGAEDGVVARCKRGTGLGAEWIDQHTTTEAPIVGVQVPMWDQVKQLAMDAHMMFPEFGVFGWDIALSDTGPLVVECNDNPYHTLYQLATGDGIMNESFMPQFDAAIACSNAMVKMRDDLMAQRIADTKQSR
ncbi:hypothetical protein GCM10007385_37210 [Tateyamaria omphalii]|uniref:sugar-transfer associated ATP-grasp domain-containing protein n=1 Tax=Tateyamaria omphalii TaxID=299262 RepID=UPI00167B03F4|nr:sugar-transfer associated ATP-grasp domain-containing protein [Tateyamaria omphalii]GGX64673.1 hypothetical protein GCM10007385_37210 [Tateyamaria omphalii]